MSPGLVEDRNEESTCREESAPWATEEIEESATSEEQQEET